MGQEVGALKRKGATNTPTDTNLSYQHRLVAH